MQKTGRNDRCPCGSGKKYKQCCLRGRTLEPANIPERIENPTRHDELKSIPYRMDHIRISEESCQQIEESIRSIFDCEEIFNPLGWESSRVNNFRQILGECATKRISDFELAIQDTANLQNLLESGIVKPEYFVSVYWNEVDQYVYYYRVKTVKLMQQTLARLIHNFADHITLAMFTRQLLEIAFSACANQWVITTCYHRLSSVLDTQIPGSIGMVNWKQLEDFVISLCCPSIADRRRIAVMTGKPSELANSKAYVKTKYEPTTNRQIKITEWVAKNFEKRTSYKGLVQRVQEVQQSYAYLCRFVHPSPLLLDMPTADKELTNFDLERSVHTCAISVVENALNIVVPMFMEPGFVRLRFQDIVERELYRYSGVAKSTIEIRDDQLLSSVLNKYKDIVLCTTDGPLEIHKHPGNSNKKHE